MGSQDPSRLYAGIDALVGMKDIGNILRNAQRSRGDGHRDWESRTTLDRSSSNWKGFGMYSYMLGRQQQALEEPKK